VPFIAGDGERRVELMRLFLSAITVVPAAE
jgi:hypothetical protein